MSIHQLISDNLYKLISKFDKFDQFVVKQPLVLDYDNMRHKYSSFQIWGQKWPLNNSLCQWLLDCNMLEYYFLTWQVTSGRAITLISNVKFS